MLKITYKEVAMLIGRSESYINVLLHRRKIKIKPEDLEKLIDLINEYRNKKGKQQWMLKS